MPREYSCPEWMTKELEVAAIYDLLERYEAKAQKDGVNSEARLKLPNYYDITDGPSLSDKKQAYTVTVKVDGKLWPSLMSSVSQYSTLMPGELRYKSDVSGVPCEVLLYNGSKGLRKNYTYDLFEEERTASMIFKFLYPIASGVLSSSLQNKSIDELRNRFKELRGVSYDEYKKQRDAKQSTVSDDKRVARGKDGSKSADVEFDMQGIRTELLQEVANHLANNEELDFKVTFQHSLQVVRESCQQKYIDNDWRIKNNPQIWQRYVMFEAIYNNGSCPNLFKQIISLLPDLSIHARKNIPNIKTPNLHTPSETPEIVIPRTPSTNSVKDTHFKDDKRVAAFTDYYALKDEMSYIEYQLLLQLANKLEAEQPKMSPLSAKNVMSTIEASYKEKTILDPLDHLAKAKYFHAMELCKYDEQTLLELIAKLQRKSIHTGSDAKNVPIPKSNVPRQPSGVAKQTAKPLDTVQLQKKVIGDVLAVIDNGQADGDVSVSSAVTSVLLSYKQQLSDMEIIRIYSERYSDVVAEVSLMDHRYSELSVQCSLPGSYYNYLSYLTEVGGRKLALVLRSKNSPSPGLGAVSCGVESSPAINSFNEEIFEPLVQYLACYDLQNKSETELRNMLAKLTRSPSAHADGGAARSPAASTNTSHNASRVTQSQSTSYVPSTQSQPYNASTANPNVLQQPSGISSTQSTSYVPSTRPQPYNDPTLNTATTIKIASRHKPCNANRQRQEPVSNNPTTSNIIQNRSVNNEGTDAVIDSTQPATTEVTPSWASKIKNIPLLGWLILKMISFFTRLYGCCTRHAQAEKPVENDSANENIVAEHDVSLQSSVNVEQSSAINVQASHTHNRTRS